MNTLSRNTPIALVVGAAGFLGSHLIEKLLSKNIQVIGVDDLSSGRKDNVLACFKNKYFHFLNQSAQSPISADLPRLDYAFFMITEDIPRHVFRSCLDNFLKFCQQWQSKIVFVSSIDLYDTHTGGLVNLKETERKLAEYSLKNSINTRIVRLSPVFGPRMHFRSNDPIARLIESAILGNLQKEATPLDFSTRALFVDDAIDLLIKAVMHGATAQKIYDGSLLHPIKITEIKQILLDPLWHENRGFVPTELPPWATPNLEKTQKELVWHPKVSLVSALKQTIHYFKERPELISKPEQAGLTRREEIGGDSQEKAVKDYPQEQSIEEEKKKKTLLPRINFGPIKNYVMIFVGVATITYALIYPVLASIFGYLVVSNNLKITHQALQAGDFTRASEAINKGERGVEILNETHQTFKILSWGGILENQTEKIDQLFLALALANQAAHSATLGTKALVESTKIVSGDKEGDLKTFSETAISQFNQADKYLSLASIYLSHQSLGFTDNIKLIISGLQQMINSGSSAAVVLPSIVGLEDKKDYLVVLQDNAILRPSGGKIISYVKVGFDKGRLVEMKAGDMSELEATVGVSDPPSDFPNTAKTLQWFFDRKNNIRTSGVIAFDTTAQNLITDQKAPHQTNETFEGFLNKIFFASDQSIVKIAQGLHKALQEKHLLIYLSDPTSFSYLVNQNWAGVLPAQAKDDHDDFLSLVETNLTTRASSAQKTIILTTKLNEDKKLSHQLAINYANGEDGLENRLKIFLPFGSRIVKAFWGNEDIINKISSFSDYGRAGYMVLINLSAGQSQVLNLEYQNQQILEEEEGKIQYKLKVIKQPGTGSDRFDFKLTLPASWKVVTPNSSSGLQEYSISSDLSQDREFEVVVAHQP